MVVLTGQADDEPLRSTARAVKDDLEQIPGVDQVLALGFQEPELLVEFAPPALAARGLTAADLAEALRLWFRDVFAGKVKTTGGEWLVRVSGANPDPELLAGFYRATAGRGRSPRAAGRRGQGATRARRSAATRQHGRPAGGDAVGQQDRLHQHAGVGRSRSRLHRPQERGAGGQRPEAGPGRRPDRGDPRGAGHHAEQRHPWPAAGAGHLLAVSRFAHFHPGRAGRGVLGDGDLRAVGRGRLHAQRLGTAGHRHRTRHVGGRCGGAGGSDVFSHGARHGGSRRRAGFHPRGGPAGAGGGDHHHRRLPAADAAAGHRRQVHVRDSLRGDGRTHHQPDRSVLDAARACRGAGATRHQPLAHPGTAREMDAPACGSSTPGC